MTSAPDLLRGLARGSQVGLISNPAARGGQARGLAGQAARHLEELGLVVEARSTAAPGQAGELAAALAQRMDAIAVLGGDGTVNEVVNGVVGTGVPLAILPGGTVNVLALELGLPFDLGRACRLLTAGDRTWLDVGCLGERRFVLMAGAGLDALAVRTVDPALKRRLPKPAFVVAGVRAFLAGPQPEFSVVVDGTPHRAVFAVAANCRHYAGRFGVAVDADPRDGLLDVVLFGGKGLVCTAAFWMAMPLGLHLRHPDVRIVRGHRVEFAPLDPRDDIWVQTDGEPAGRLPAVATVRPHALEVFVPAEATRPPRASTGSPPGDR